MRSGNLHEIIDDFHLATNEKEPTWSRLDHANSHASITLTMDTYPHVMPDMQQGASNKLERMLFTKTGTQ
jgi:hypothetical protein